MECLILKTLLFSETNNKQILFFVKHSSLWNISRRLHRLIIWMEYIKLKLNIQALLTRLGGRVAEIPSWGHGTPGSNPATTCFFFFSLLFFLHIFPHLCLFLKTYFFLFIYIFIFLNFLFFSFRMTIDHSTAFTAMFVDKRVPRLLISILDIFG